MKYNIKSIQADLGIFTSISAYSDISKHIHPSIIQVYSESCATLTNSEPEAYSELRHIQSLDIFRTLVSSEQWHIQNPDLSRTQIYLEP